jgi:hypothetical protein
MKGRLSGALSFHIQCDNPITISRLRIDFDDRLTFPTDLVLRSPRGGRLEGRSSAHWSALRDATPAAPLLRTRLEWEAAPTLAGTANLESKVKTEKRRNFRC